MCRALGPVEAVVADQEPARAQNILRPRHEGLRQEEGVPAFVGAKLLVQHLRQRLPIGLDALGARRVNRLRLAVGDEGVDQVKVRPKLAAEHDPQLRTAALLGERTALERVGRGEKRLAG